MVQGCIKCQWWAVCSIARVGCLIQRPPYSTYTDWFERTQITCLGRVGPLSRQLPDHYRWYHCVYTCTSYSTPALAVTLTFLVNNRVLLAYMFPLSSTRTPAGSFWGKSMMRSSSSVNRSWLTGALVDGSAASGRSTIFCIASLVSSAPTPGGWCTGGRRNTGTYVRVCTLRVKWPPMPVRDNILAIQSPNAHGSWRNN